MSEDDQQLDAALRIQQEVAKYIQDYPRSSLAQSLRRIVDEVEAYILNEYRRIAERASRQKRWQYTP